VHCLRPIGATVIFARSNPFNNTMAYKMLVLDLDDTLLTDDYRISDKNKKALIKAQDAGVMVVLASGHSRQASCVTNRNTDI
jgi:predicted HAD superfamily phosphohydrolase YqeG